MTEPTLEEQIEFAIGEYQDAERNLFDDACRNISAILASLKELAAIRSAELPVEPKIYTKTFMRGNTMEEHEVVLKHDYDALKSYALKRDAELAALQLELARLNGDIPYGN